MRWVIIGGILLLGLLAGVAGAADGPLADAGLDQSVTQGATVYLDAGGSTAPDGEITSYEWTIERPNGTETTPGCSNCVCTSFVADQAGTYAVTVEVTDGDGVTDRDTLYVEVSAREMPEATLEGPTTLTVGEAGTFSIDSQAGDSPLSSYAWTVGGESRDTNTWASEPTTQITFAAPGEYTIAATVTDAAGYEARVEQTVFVEPNETDGETVSGVGGQSEESAGSLGTTYDRMFVDESGDMYIAVGDELGERDAFSMYLPNGRELKVSINQIAQRPGPMIDNTDTVSERNSVLFERESAKLEYFETRLERMGYSVDELKSAIPDGECQLSDEAAQQCVEQSMVLLTEEAQKEQGQSFINRGESWIEQEFEGHPTLGPESTWAPYKQNNDKGVNKSGEQRGVQNDPSEQKSIDNVQSVPDLNDRLPIHDMGRTNPVAPGTEAPGDELTSNPPSEDSSKNSPGSSSNSDKKGKNSSNVSTNSDDSNDLTVI